MPALSYETVNASRPVFDVLATPSCVGALTEYFRTRPGTLRSVHPTHSVSGSGPRAADLLGEHALDRTPVGPHSPFARLPEVGGQLLFLGCGLRPNTSMHGIEEHVIPEYLFGDELDYHILLPGGQQRSMRVRRHNFRGWQQRYDRIEQIMETGLTQGRVLQASCTLLDAAALWQAALAKMRAEPLFFVDRSSAEE
jgi:aminoglycoside 3-N-acetyltransferase